MSQPSSAPVRSPPADAHESHEDYVYRRELEESKKQPWHQVTPIPAQHGDVEQNPPHESTPEWNPGFISRFPWLGLGALFFVLVLSGCAIIVLVVSDGRSQRNWPNRIRPPVILNGLNSISNICFSVAIANGIAIAWWRKTLKGATIEQLHKSWSFGTSVKDAALAGRAFNVIALAALTAKFTIIDGLLMQSATDTILRQDPGLNVVVQGTVAATIPVTGQIQGNGISGILSEYLRENVNLWDRNPAQLPLTMFEGCEGQCFVTAPIASFEIDCTDTTEDIIIPTNAMVTDSQGIPTGAISNATIPMYNVTFASTSYEMELGSQENLTMEIMYTKANQGSDTDSRCPGQQHRHFCTLRPAVVELPVLIQNISLVTTDEDSKSDAGDLVQNITGVRPGISEDSYRRLGVTAPGFEGKQQIGAKVKQMITIHEQRDSSNEGSLAQLAPLAAVFNLYLGGSASLNGDYGTGTNWKMIKTGNSPMYQTNNDDFQNSCAYQFQDPLYPDKDSPLDSIVASINQIMFAVSANAARSSDLSWTLSRPMWTDVVRTIPDAPSYDYANPSTWTQYKGQMYRRSIHFSTNYAYMAGAVASTLFCVLCILPVYYGFWELGRKVSLGPFEIAHAFRSPMTADARQGNIDEVLRECGHREVQYGNIVAGDAKGVVGIAEPEYIARLGGQGGGVAEKGGRGLGR